MNKLLLSLLFCLSLYSCENHNDREIQTTLQDILATKDPSQGLIKLDSIEETVSEQSRYVRMRYELVKARLQDRAFVKPQSTKLAKQLVEYFENKGSLQDLQLAYYVAGSTFRDMRDAPTAIDYFLKSESIAEKIEGATESILYVCTISNLSYLYSNVLNYQSCLKYSLKEYQLSLKLNDLEPTTITHLGYAYLHCDSIDKAFEYYDMALDGQLQTNKRDLEIISKILYDYVEYKKITEADTCAHLIKDLYKKNIAPTSNSDNAMGRYYLMTGNVDSAMMCFENVLDKKEDLNDMYDVSKALFEAYRQRGDLKKATEFAQAFVAVNDSLELGKRQEKTATIDNWYQYVRDIEEEKRVMEENRAYKELILEIIMMIAILTIIFLLIIYHYRKKQMLKIVSLNDAVKNIGKEKEKMNRLIQILEQELQQAQEEKDEIDKVLVNVNDNLRKTEEELREKSELNKNILRQMRQNQLGNNTEGILQKLKEAAKGKLNLTDQDWDELYRSVDDKWPSFSEQVYQMKSFNEERKKVCYLWKSGFKTSEIQHQTNLSRSTIWRIVAQCEGWIV